MLGFKWRLNFCKEVGDIEDESWVPGPHPGRRESGDEEEMSCFTPEFEALQK